MYLNTVHQGTEHHRSSKKRPCACEENKSGSSRCLEVTWDILYLHLVLLQPLCVQEKVPEHGGVGRWLHGVSGCCGD